MTGKRIQGALLQRVSRVLHGPSTENRRQALFARRLNRSQGPMAALRERSVGGGLPSQEVQLLRWNLLLPSSILFLVLSIPHVIAFRAQWSLS